MTSRDEILARVTRRYGSLERPDFHWVQLEHDRDPHADLWRALNLQFEVADTTDLNSDVSFAYDLKPRQGSGSWTLRLSMVGPYAMIIRLEASSAEAIVNGPLDAKSPNEALIVEVCVLGGFEVLSKDLLFLPIPLRLFETAPERVRVYQALFADVDFVPGEYAQTP